MTLRVGDAPPLAVTRVPCTEGHPPRGDPGDALGVRSEFGLIGEEETHRVSMFKAKWPARHSKFQASGM